MLQNAQWRRNSPTGRLQRSVDNVATINQVADPNATAGGRFTLNNAKLHQLVNVAGCRTPMNFGPHSTGNLAVAWRNTGSRDPLNDECQRLVSPTRR